MRRVTEDWCLELGDLRSVNSKIYADIHLDGKIEIISVIAKLRLLLGQDPFVSLDVKELLTAETRADMMRYLRTVYPQLLSEDAWGIKEELY